jgi:hypothetical protein
LPHNPRWEGTCDQAIQISCDALESSPSVAHARDPVAGDAALHQTPGHSIMSFPITISAVDSDTNAFTPSSLATPAHRLTGNAAASALIPS